LNKTSVIGSFETRPTDDRDADAHKGCRRSDRIGAVVPGIALHRGAGEFTADFQDEALKGLLGGDHKHQDHQGKPSRRMMRRDDLPDTLSGDKRRRTQESDRHQHPAIDSALPWP